MLLLLISLFSCEQDQITSTEGGRHGTKADHAAQKKKHGTDGIIEAQLEEQFGKFGKHGGKVLTKVKLLVVRD
jgi:hypothetical protein